MKKKFRFALVVCAAMAALCSCTNDELVDQSGNGTGNGALTFNMQVKNRTRTRAEATALQSTHYEFGVSGFAESVSGENAYMQNYLVAYADPSDTKYKPWADANVATTWGDNNSILNGNSYWVYERLGNTNVTGKATKSVHTNQYLRYWDETTSNSYFYAYAPYKTVTETIDGTDYKVTLNNVSSFYTQPVVQMTGAVSKGLMKNGTYASEEPLTEDRDIINANEVIYAATTVTKANYGNDVPFEFKHANAQIRLAFYTDITSYDVTLTDLVPEEISGSPFTIAKQEGIVLTPADATNKTYNATSPTTQPTPNTEFVTGYNALTITDGTSLVWGTTPTKSSGNLLFKVPDPTLSTSKLSTTPSELTYLPTIYYAVPAPESNSGFTVHVSYKLKSKATGTDDQIQLYDARVWVPAANCQWEAGKAYTYIFKITDKSSGTTDPQREDPADNTKPYIDPSDPRVIETGELHPIEFTAMVLTDFDEIYDGLFNISNELKTKPLVEDPLDESIRYTEFATNGVKPLNEYTFLSPTNISSVFSELTDITYTPETHMFTREYTTVAGKTVNISFSALSYTNYLNGTGNSAYTYVYTGLDGSALKLTATQPESEEDDWTVTSTENVPNVGYGHALYIKNLGSASIDNAIVNQTISFSREFDGLYNLSVDNAEKIPGVTCAINIVGTKQTITLSGTPTAAGIYKYTFTEETLNRTFVLTVTVDNELATAQSKSDDETYRYTTKTNYKIPSLSGYDIILPEGVNTDPEMQWSYNSTTKKATYSNGDHTMTFDVTESSDEIYVAFWKDAITINKITFSGSDGSTATSSSDIQNAEMPAYTIFKKH